MSRKIPANIQPFVDALGVDHAYRVILWMGGSDVYLPAKRPTDNSKLSRIVGADKVMALSRRLGLDGTGGYIKIPVARRWLALVLNDGGVGRATIARVVRADVASVRKWINGAEDQ